MSVLSRIWLFTAPWIVAQHALLSMEFPRQEYWSGWPFLCPGDLPDPGLLHLLHWQVDSLPLVPPGKPLHSMYYFKKLTLGLFNTTQKFNESFSLGNSVFGPLREKELELVIKATVKLCWVYLTTIPTFVSISPLGWARSQVGGWWRHPEVWISRNMMPVPQIPACITALLIFTRGWEAPACP